MRCVVQRVTWAKVEVEGRVTGEIGRGLLVFVGFEALDGLDDQTWMVNKLLNLRIFPDAEGVMNLSVQEIGADVLVVSQFSLMASTKKGHRPSYIKADKPNTAMKKYHDLVIALAKQSGKMIETGEFGAMMQVSLLNDGPLTIVIDSKSKE
ncbi:MAG: D-tyrosyl-tRNA(Tyr) deacylase [Bacteroidetes bacterium]|jgi:D-tyrosyl-tRNA(Tyr) deacylase|nr:D-tyrosyl-tRNA(Tyr) deacylase [Bacteroidota bacterium]